MRRINPHQFQIATRGTSREINGEKKTITSVEVGRGKRRGDFVIRVHIDGGPSRQAGP